MAEPTFTKAVIRDKENDKYIIPYVNDASDTEKGIVQVDGTTIVAEDGVITVIGFPGLQEEVEQLESDLLDLTGVVGTNTENISTLQGDVAAHAENISALQTNVNALLDTIDGGNAESTVVSTTSEN